jgi:enamine deaminase RidA (YjgF/YER057c/UK114 family)
MTVEEKLASLGIVLPAAPLPGGSYAPIVVSGTLGFIAGQIPTKGGEVKFKGKIGKDLPVEAGQQAARLCTINALSHLKLNLGSLDRIKRFVKVTGFVNCDASFTDHSKVINGASDLLIQLFGEDGKHARTSIGVNSLPLDAAVEVEFICEI